jgi:preprotein translocase subunit YajC
LDFFLQAQSAPPGWTTWILPAGMIGIFYFLIIRPQQKRTRAHRALLDDLKKGDRVITSGGMHGEVVGLKDDIVVLCIDQKLNVKVEVTRSNVASVMQ